MNNEERWLLEEKYGGEKSEGFFTDLERLKAGEPLAYIIGSIPFLGCKIWLDSKPLIPRPETEFWVEKAIKSIEEALPATTPKYDLGVSLSRTSGVAVLDLCAGSGCIGVAIAKAVPVAHVTFGEIEPAHLPTIGKNLEENDISCTRYQVYQTDLFTKINSSSRSHLELSKFDYILTNPPYIDPEVDRAEQSVKNHEPHQALYGGKAGLELIERIIADSPSHLNPGGQLWIEHEPEQSQSIKALAKKFNFEAITHTDQYKIERYSVLSVSKN